MNDLRKQAEELSAAFLQDTQYRLGFVEAEQPNPLTRHLGEAYVADTCKGVETLLGVDDRLPGIFGRVYKSEAYRRFAQEIKQTLEQGGRIILSGCGSSGRLCMRLEASWRKATGKDNVLSLMTGGDYALIRAVESFEDRIELGMEQAKTYRITKKDILIGVTATGETTSILGTAMQALADGARVWMVICTDPQTILGKLKRVDDVFTHPGCSVLYIPCGGMAVTGSTRMQSSTLEQAVIGTALEECLSEHDFTADFEKTLHALHASIDEIVACTDAETELYRQKGHITYFADEYLLDVLADTTERGPTFCVPPFRPQSRPEEPLSWAFVKNPLCATKQAWFSCFGRTPRCLENSGHPIGLASLYEFCIGNEPDPERQRGNSMALWVGEEAPQAFFEQASAYRQTRTLLLTPPSCPTHMDLWEHLYAKMLLNIFSTGVMAKLGRIYGNYMVNMKISNKKLVDRGSRMVADLCGISYEEANKELYFSYLAFPDDSPVKTTVDRLKNNILQGDKGTV